MTLITRHISAAVSLLFVLFRACIWMGWGGLGDYSYDVTNGLGTPFPEYHSLTRSHVLRVFDEPEMDDGFIARS